MNAQQCARDEVVLGLTSSELLLVVGFGGLGVAVVVVVVAWLIEEVFN